MRSDPYPFPRRTAPLPVVFVEQLRLVWDRDKWQLLVLLVLFLNFGQALYYQGGFATLSTLLILFLAGIWGEMIWRDEETGHLSYGLAMPFQVRNHRLLRVAAGAVWFLAVFLLGTSSQIATHLSPDPLTRRLLELPAWLVLAWPFALLTVYLMVSALTIVNGKPSIWAALIITAIAVMSGLAGAGLMDRIGLSLPGQALRSLTFGDYGIVTALAPSLFIPDPSLVRHFGYPSPESWNHVLPTMAWFLLAVALVVSVAGRHREA